MEYALSRITSPALVAQYQLQLPDKKLLQAKLHELFELESPQDCPPMFYTDTKRRIDTAQIKNQQSEIINRQSRPSAPPSTTPPIHHSATPPSLDLPRAPFHLARDEPLRIPLPRRAGER